MAPDIGAICAGHLRFTKWADNLLLKAVRENMPSRTETLEHVFMAERIWLARIEGTDPAGSFEEWEKLHERWLALAESERDWARVIRYRTLAGVASSSPLWQIVLHVANHGSYHRGQVAAALRAAGFAPPGTDLITWYRSQGS
jgi:uncharacterized damage-inducible protein DinB